MYKASGPYRFDKEIFDVKFVRPDGGGLLHPLEP